MKHLVSFFILVFLASCGSDDSDSGTQTTPKGPPPPFALEEPSRSPGNDSTPTLRIRGVKTGSVVTLYKDPSCDTQTSLPVTVESGDFALITSYDLSGDTDAFGYGEVTFYAAVRESADSNAVCLKSSVSYAFDILAPEPPASLALEDPAISPGTDPTPTINVSGVEGEAVVTLYKDSSCEMPISDSARVFSGESAVSITAKSLGDGSQDVEVSFYAVQADRVGNRSPCSTATVSYVLDLTAPAAPTGLSLSDPSTSPGENSTPIILVEGVEEGASVTLYSDSSCSSALSSAQTVQAGQTSILITSNDLGASDRTVNYYSAQVDIFNRSSGCSTASVTYALDVAVPKPSRLVLQNPSTSPSSNPTPIIRVEGLTSGAQIRLYSDSACTNSMTAWNTVAQGSNWAALQSNHLGTSDRTVTYYAMQKKGGKSSGCSTASVTYQLVFLPLDEVSVETGSYFHDDPSSDVLRVSATFSENVSVTGTPRIELTIGAATKYATYTSGSGTSTLIFSYDVSSDDYDNDGIEMASTIDLNGGEIKNGSNTDATLNFTAPDNLGRVWINFREKVFSTSRSFAFLKKGGSVVTWGSNPNGGNSSSVSSDLTSGVREVFSTGSAFAALKSNGSVVTWGNSSYGGNSSGVSGDLASGVSEVFSTSRAFAALKSNGSVVTWGNSSYGGNSSGVSGDLASGVSEVFSTSRAFAALKSNGSVVTWGDSSYGGNSSSVSGDLASGVSEIFSNVYAFAALKSNGSVVTWGNSSRGGDSSSVSGDLASGVSEVFSTSRAFAALKSNGSVVTWGDSSYGGNSSSVSSDLASGVSEIFSTGAAFAALKSNGSVVTWGYGSHGGDSSSVSGDLASGVSEIFSNTYAFAALKGNGSVVTWGDSSHGGDSSSVSGDLASGVNEVFSSGLAFAALKDNGSVVTWGLSTQGGNSSSVSGDLASGVSEIFSTYSAFAALKSNGSVVTWGDSNYGGDSASVDLNPRW